MKAGDTLGEYTLVRALSRGGMGEVYLAERGHGDSFRKKVALKVMRPEHQGDETHRRLFFAEARLAAQLNHPNVAQVFDFGEDEKNNVLYLAMEFLEGESLAQVLQRRGLMNQAHHALPPRVAATIVAQAARGLHHAHTLQDESGRALNVVHRDVSPQNIFVTRAGVSKVLDFGIAKTKDSTVMTEMGVIKGKPGYLAPEQVMGDPIDARADIFQLGIVLYETLSGRPLFLRDNLYAAARAVVDDPVPDLREVAPQVPEAMVAACERALTKDPAARTQSALELATWLESASGPVDPAEVSALLAPKVESSASIPVPVGRPEGVGTALADSVETESGEQPTSNERPTPPKASEGDTSEAPTAVMAGPSAPAAVARVHEVQPQTHSTIDEVELEVPRPLWQRRSFVFASMSALLGGAAGYLVWRSRDERTPVVAKVVDAGPPRDDAGPTRVATKEFADAGPTKVASVPEVADKPTRRRRRRRRRDKEPDKVPEVKVPDKAPDKVPDEVPAGPPGKLVLRAHPVARITVDGKPRGNTPKTLKVDPGKHRVRLVELGTGVVRVDREVSVASGARVVVNPNAQ